MKISIPEPLEDVYYWEQIKYGQISDRNSNYLNLPFAGSTVLTLKITNPLSFRDIWKTISIKKDEKKIIKSNDKKRYVIYLMNNTSNTKLHTYGISLDIIFKEFPAMITTWLSWLRPNELLLSKLWRNIDWSSSLKQLLVTFL